MFLARRTAAVIALVLLGTLAQVGPVQAVDVTVRARTRLTLAAVALGRRVSFEGALRDNINQGLRERRVELLLRPLGGAASEPVRRSLVTDANGRFVWTGLLPDGRWGARAHFAGDDLLAPATATATLEVERQTVALFLTLPPASPDWSRLPVRLSAEHPTIPTRGLPVRLAVDGVPLRAGLTLDAEGRFEAELDQPSGPGRRLVEAVFVGNPIFAPASAGSTVQIYGVAELSLGVAVETRHEAWILTLSGQLQADIGPLAGVPVALAVEGLALSATAVTGEDGRFSEVLTVAGLETDRAYVVRAWVDPHGTPVADLRLEAEAAFTVEGGLLDSAGRWGSVFAVALAIAIGAALIIGRSRALLRARRAARAAAAPPGQAAPRGLIELSPKRAGARPNQTRVSGRVRDADTAEPLERGEVCVRRADDGESGERVFPVATDGSFSTEPLEPGLWSLQVRAPGFVTTRLSARVPHAGRYADIEVFLCSVRSWVRFLYQEMSLGLSLRDDDGHRWGRATPRQIERLLVDAYRSFVSERPSVTGLTAFREGLQAILDDPARVPSDRVLRALTLLVEEVYYSGRVYAEDLVDLCRSLIEGVEASIEAGRVGAS